MPNGLDAVTTITRPPAGIAADVAREYERAVRDVLAGEDGPVEVQFGALGRGGRTHPGRLPRGNAPRRPVRPRAAMAVVVAAAR